MQVIGQSETNVTRESRHDTVCTMVRVSGLLRSLSEANAELIRCVVCSGLVRDLPAQRL